MLLNIPKTFKSYNQLQLYENGHFQLEYRFTLYIFQVREHGLF